MLDWDRLSVLIWPYGGPYDEVCSYLGVPLSISRNCCLLLIGRSDLHLTPRTARHLRPFTSWKFTSVCCTVGHPDQYGGKQDLLLVFNLNQSTLISRSQIRLRSLVVRAKPSPHLMTRSGTHRLVRILCLHLCPLQYLDRVSLRRFGHSSILFLSMPLIFGQAVPDS